MVGLAYIIENANVLKSNQLIKCSILIRENRIAAFQTQLNQYRLIKMNAEDYIMTPSYVLFNSKIPLNGSFQEVKEYMIRQFLLKGCTTFLTCVTISIENELTEKVKEIKTALMNSPIDFIIGVRCPLHLITPSFIRKCKKEKIPAIFVEITETNEFENIPWSWIKEAMFPFNSPLIPIISDSLKKEAKSILSKWRVNMVNEKIPAIYEELEEGLPLPISVLNKIGLYPNRGSLMHGAELSYNLYLKGKEINNVDDRKLFYYHRDRLIVTVHKGNVIRSGEEVLFRPGIGEYVKVRTPAYFSF